jgi:hypothetical protein
MDEPAVERAVAAIAGLASAGLNIRDAPSVACPQLGSSVMTLPPAATLPFPPLPPTPAI